MISQRNGKDQGFIVHIENQTFLLLGNVQSSWKGKNK